jgi:hypothetical protein
VTEDLENPVAQVGLAAAVAAVVKKVMHAWRMKVLMLITGL